VVGYFSLASGSINLVTATGGFQWNMPDPIAVMLLARLAMDRRLQGRGGGKALQAEAAKRVLGGGREHRGSRAGGACAERGGGGLLQQSWI
jgi:hypothetical protein